MKFAIIGIFFAALATGVLSKPPGLILGYQDSLGQYSFGYSEPHQARSEVRSLDGVTRGSYSYVDGAGLIQSTDYTADGQHGFRVAATNLPQAPVPVQETPEVAAARAAHLLAVEKAIKGVQQPLEADGITILAKSAEKEAEPDKKADLATEPEAQKIEEGASEIQTPEALAEAAAAADADENKGIEESKAKTEEPMEKEKGRAIDDAEAVAPVLASPAALPLPVPLIPVNFDLPTIAAYSSRLAAAKADQLLPEVTLAQGLNTPAGTTLKTLSTPQLVRLAPQLVLPSGQLSASGITLSGSPSTSGSQARDITHLERARAVLAPLTAAPVNVIPFGYDPAATYSSFLRYAPYSYVSYNIL